MRRSEKPKYYYKEKCLRNLCHVVNSKDSVQTEGFFEIVNWKVFF